MIAALLATALIFAPVNLDTDQAALARLVAKRLDKSHFSDPTNTPIWSGSGCTSRMRTPQVGPVADMEFDWKTVAVGQIRSERYFLVGGVVYPNDSANDTSLLMPFLTAEDAEAARAAMMRLKIACTPA